MLGPMRETATSNLKAPSRDRAEPARPSRAPAQREIAPGSGGSPQRRSLAAEVASRIEEKIVQGKWPVGHPIGREAELATEFGVSRWTLREATRILEASGLCIRRKGGGGGLFVASDSHDFVCKLIGNYFEVARVSEAEFFDIHRALGRLSVRAATTGMSQAVRQHVAAQLNGLPNQPLAAMIAASSNIQEALRRNSANPVLRLFSAALSQMAFDAAIYSDLSDTAWNATIAEACLAIMATAEAMIRGDGAAAIAAHDRYVAGCRVLIRAAQPNLGRPISREAAERAYAVFPPSRPMKKIDEVERHIREMILDGRLPVGSRLGAEAELARSLGVGRWLLREALRSLEQLGVITIGRGGRSGLMVVAPDPSMVAEYCLRYLRREGAQKRHAAEVRTALLAGEGSDAPGSIRSLFLGITAELG